MSDILEKCQKIMSFAPPSELDGFARKQLGKNLHKYLSSVDKRLADAHFKIDSKPYSSLFDAIYEKKGWDEVEIDFFRPNTSDIWEYDTPTKVIKMNRNGRGALMLFQVDPFALNQWNQKQEPKIEPAMFRTYLEHFYSPESIKTNSKKVDEKPVVPPRPLCSLSELWEDIRGKGIVPFQVVICAYTQEKRYLYRLDIPDNLMLMDFRNGKIPIANMVSRHPIDYHNLDKVMSTQELPQLARRVLAVFFELEDADRADIQIGMGITEKMARDNIYALEKRGLIATKGRGIKARYEINLGSVRDLAEELVG